MFGFCLGLRADYFFSPPFSPLLFPSFFLTTKSFHSKNVQFLVKCAPPLPSRTRNKKMPFLVKWAPPLPNPKHKYRKFRNATTKPRLIFFGRQDVVRKKKTNIFLR